MLDLPLSRLFFKAFTQTTIRPRHSVDTPEGCIEQLEASARVMDDIDMTALDPLLGKALSQMLAISKRKKNGENPETLTFDGSPIKDLELNFVVPGKTCLLKNECRIYVSPSQTGRCKYPGFS